MRSRRANPLLTHRVWVARTRLGFIVPTATAGGDVLPLHDTPAAPNIDWTFSPTRPPAHTFSFAAETVTLGDPDPPTKRDTPTTTIIDREFIEERPPNRCPMPWSVAVAVPAVGLVYLVAIASGTAGSLIGSLAVVAALVCGLLLVVGQLIGGSKR